MADCPNRVLMLVENNAYPFDTRVRAGSQAGPVSACAPCRAWV